MCDLPLSSQSLAPPPECTDEVDETELLRFKPYSRGSFLTPPLTEEPLGLLETLGRDFGLRVLLPPLRALLPARNSSNRRGRGRRCVLSYKPHLLQTILPGFRVDLRQLGGSVVWQLKQRRRRYWVSFEAASSVCCTGSPVWGER